MRTLNTGQDVFDPRGVVDTQPRTLAPRPRSLDGIRLGILDNSKWNASKLLRRLTALLGEGSAVGRVTYYKKDSFSRTASRELLDKIARENQAVLTAIGD